MAAAVVDQCSCHKQPFASPAVMRTHYLHGWKAPRATESERGKANNAHLGALLHFVVFEQYDAPAPLLWGERER